MKPLPHTYVVKDRYWYFRFGAKAKTRIQGEPFSAEFMWHYRQLMHQSGADARKARARARIRRLEKKAETRGETFVYFIGVPETGPVKIGWAKDVGERLCTLQTGSHLDLAILTTTVGGVELEREYQRRFSASHLRGEWFELTQDIADEIENIRGRK